MADEHLTLAEARVLTTARDRLREALLYIAHYSYDVMRTPDEELRAIKDFAEKAALRPESDPAKGCEGPSR